MNFFSQSSTCGDTRSTPATLSAPCTRPSTTRSSKKVLEMDRSMSAKTVRGCSPINTGTRKLPDPPLACPSPQLLRSPVRWWETWDRGGRRAAQDGHGDIPFLFLIGLRNAIFRILQQYQLLGSILFRHDFIGCDAFRHFVGKSIHRLLVLWSLSGCSLNSL